MKQAGVHEMGTSPNCRVVNAAGTRLYSTNETDRVGPTRRPSKAFGDRKDGKLARLNTTPGMSAAELLANVEEWTKGREHVTQGESNVMQH